MTTTFWLTGLPASGKTTLANALAERLRSEGRAVLVLDGDEVRKTLCSDLGFDDAGRAENVRRVAAVAAHAGHSGIDSVVALISPLLEHRRAARALVEAAGQRFVEVYLATSLAVCRARDPKGLYARAAQGDVKGLTGVSAPYEPPVHCEVIVAEGWSVEASARAVCLAAGLG